MKNEKFRLSFVLHIKGKSTISNHLRLQLETIITDTVVPMLSSLKNTNEELNIMVGIVDCNEAEDIIIHKCLDKISFKKKIEIKGT